ncbi:MAG: ABC transporter substrate-binding protein [Rhodospirillales bacterium]
MKCLPLLLAILSLVATGPARAQSGPDRVVLQLKWLHQFQFAGYYAAIEKGFYREAGLEVELREAKTGMDPMAEVIAGRADFGVGTTDILLMRDRGEPVVVLAAIMQHSPLALMTRRDGGRRNIHQLAAGRLMIEPHSAELFAYFTREGIDVSKLDLVEHDFDVGRVLDGTIDAMSVYSTDEPWRMQVQAVDYTLFRPVDSGIDFYGDNLFTTETQIDDHPDRVDAFLAASLKGWEYAMRHPEEIAQLIVDRYSDRKGLDWLLFEAKGMQEIMQPEVVSIGYLNADRWQRIAEIYTELGYISSPPDTADYLYDPESETGAFLLRILVPLLLALAVTALITIWYMRHNRRLRREIDERIAAQDRLEETGRQKDMLLSIVGHDLRTPFNILLVYGEMLAKDAATMDRERLTRIGQAVRDASASAFALLNNLMDWATLQTGMRSAVTRQAGLAQIAAAAIEMQRPIADTKKIAIEEDTGPDHTAYCDPVMIETVVRNLIGNALKFTRPGGTVTVRSRLAGDRAEIVVTDNGVGMDPDTLEAVFTGNMATSLRGTEGEKGTGIGLSLCRQLVDANDGTLVAESRPGAGTTVVVSLPRE